jgi:chemotaxis signal transduction protein
MSEKEPKAGATVADHSLVGKYLTFTIQSESYGINVLKVREIIRHIGITPCRRCPRTFGVSSTCAGRSFR